MFAMEYTPAERQRYAADLKRISQIEDPVERQLATDTFLDHAKAKARGIRALEIADTALGALDGHGLVRDAERARVILWSAIADALYGNAAIDIPQLRRD
jgi:hypothetical protein